VDGLDIFHRLHFNDDLFAYPKVQPHPAIKPHPIVVNRQINLTLKGDTHLVKLVAHASFIDGLEEPRSERPVNAKGRLKDL
jgi:hypothetical protein